MSSTLLGWIGNADIEAATRGDNGIGPLGQAVASLSFDRVILLSAKAAADNAAVSRFLASQSCQDTKIEVRGVKLDSPIDFRAIYPLANEAIESILNAYPEDELTIHLSPGTPAMASVWILLAAKAGVTIKLIQSSTQRGVQEADIPFDIHADYVPNLVRGQSRRLNRAITEPADVASGFSGIIFQSDAMGSVISQAQKIAVFDIPMLIQGESGTGKELFARAIHDESLRREGPYRPINCGAIPENLIDTELFGYVKGAFTGADKARPGEFERANGGTLFLDEIGELSLAAQTRLLRVLQSGKVRPVGPGTDEKDVDVRIVSATNRDLIDEVRKGNFREDLYFRLAATSIKLPPLRERMGDKTLLIDTLFGKKCRELGISEKSLSAGARKALNQHDWPGNVRELEWTLARAIVLSEKARISSADMEYAIEVVHSHQDDLLNRPLGAGFSVEMLLEDIKQRYVVRALEKTHYNQSQAAELLGMKQQTLSAFIKSRKLPRAR